jgi:hypothetical protein
MLEETNVDDMTDAAIIRGMWAAAEDAAGDDDEAEDGDALLEQLDPSEVGAWGFGVKHMIVCSLGETSSHSFLASRANSALEQA